MATDEMLCAQLMKAAKTGNAKEVKKLLHKGALFTKDEVNHINIVLHTELVGMAANLIKSIKTIVSGYDIIQRLYKSP